MNGAVPVCFDKDVACGEVHPKNRCVNCPLGSPSPSAREAVERIADECDERRKNAHGGTFADGYAHGLREIAKYCRELLTDRAYRDSLPAEKRKEGSIWHGSPRCPFCNRTDDHSHTYSSLIDAAAPAQESEGNGMNAREYEVWCEGYQATGNWATAEYWGKVVASSFGEAAEALAKKKFSAESFARSFKRDGDKVSFWGCNCFDNEADARRFFG